MATLADMKASIADEIFRDDRADAIAREITRAIVFYQRHRFHFNETRALTFATVAGQEFYDASVEARIPNLIEIDYVQLPQQGGTWSLPMASTEDIDQWAGLPSSGRPTSFAYFEGQLRFYPSPNGVYSVRVACHYRVDPPLSDDATSNPWMNDGEELIRSRAKRNLYLHSLADVQMAAAMKAAEDEAYVSLKREASLRQNVHAFATPGLDF